MPNGQFAGSGGRKNRTMKTHISSQSSDLRLSGGSELISPAFDSINRGKISFYSTAKKRKWITMASIIFILSIFVAFIAVFLFKFLTSDGTYRTHLFYSSRGFLQHGAQQYSLDFIDFSYIYLTQFHCVLKAASFI